MSNEVEQATLNFYEWEQYGRGYKLYPFPVDIEPPHLPRLLYQTSKTKPYIDDGRIPSLLDTIKDAFTSKKEVQENSEEDEIDISPYEYQRQGLRVMRLSFSRKQAISHQVSAEMLHMLSYSNEPFSFELIGDANAIHVQLGCSLQDYDRAHSLWKAYFPSIIIEEVTPDSLPFNKERACAIIDFGLDEEFTRPIAVNQNFSLDSLTSIIGTLNSLKHGEVAMLQVIFKGVLNTWAGTIMQAVSDGQGGSFFADSPEMLPLAREKVQAPLFGAVVRMIAQSNSNKRTESLAYELVQNIASVSQSSSNMFIPLSNEGYPYQSHLANVFARQTNRLGMILNTNELLGFIHYPNENIQSYKFNTTVRKTKVVPSQFRSGKYVLGINEHGGNQHPVYLNDEDRLRHMHIIGATGVGKSTLISHLVSEDIKAGNGLALFDPHGDLIDDIIERIPEERLEDVILVDPSDIEYPVGFNLLSAQTESEKIVLSSDLVGAFKKHATSWGDQMTAVLSNAIIAFLESSKGGTLLELRRFLLEGEFRNEFLKTIVDPSVTYYWKHEFPMLKRASLSPLLTRLDTFLRPKVIRYMLSQQKGVDFAEALEKRKIILIKLSQGLIGEENSYLLGTLFLSKFNQVAQARQITSKDNRNPFYIYLDEFHNFLTPSIASMLSGARKYGIGLVLAHQDLAQISHEDNRIQSSILANPAIRVCFRVGDRDAKALENGFSSFEAVDLQNLVIGEALVRIEQNQNDFSLNTIAIESHPKDELKLKYGVIQTNTQDLYAEPREVIEKRLNTLLGSDYEEIAEHANIEPIEESLPKSASKDEQIPSIPTPEIAEGKFEERAKKYIDNVSEQQEVREHYQIQLYIKKIAEERGFKAVIEEPAQGGKVDVGLSLNDLRIACEVSVTNTIEYEIHNIEKCLRAGYAIIFVITENEKSRNLIRERVIQKIESRFHQQIFFVLKNELSESLDGILLKVKPKNEKRIGGYRVKVEYLDSKIQRNQVFSGLIKKVKGKYQ